MKKNSLSVVLATYNEEENIGRCLGSVKDIADEIVVVDGSSSDKTLEIAKALGARIFVVSNKPIFHINKQKALDEARCKWILQLDADEVVSDELGKEINEVISMDDAALEIYQERAASALFLRHQKIIEQRDGKIGRDDSEYCAFFVPRMNYFLGTFLRFGGVYPDGVIRLVRRGKAHFPCKSVHEQIEVDGQVGWLKHNLLHYDSPNFARYLAKNSRYIDLIVDEMKRDKVDKGLRGLFLYMVVKPTSWFFMTQIRHKGILDGFPGLVFSFFSALRFPRAFWRYVTQ